jgi:hypothetical protein
VGHASASLPAEYQSLTSATAIAALVRGWLKPENRCLVPANASPFQCQSRAAITENARPCPSQLGSGTGPAWPLCATTVSPPVIQEPINGEAFPFASKRFWPPPLRHGDIVIDNLGWHKATGCTSRHAAAEPGSSTCRNAW